MGFVMAAFVHGLIAHEEAELLLVEHFGGDGFFLKADGSLCEPVVVSSLSVGTCFASMLDEEVGEAVFGFGLRLVFPVDALNQVGVFGG